MTLDDIDFAALYREHMERWSAVPKTSVDWDSRASSYAKNSGQSNYVDDFIARLDLGGARTLLDVGCGPGTLALPLAGRLDRVVALDYSAGMLRALSERAQAKGITNIETHHLAWVDDWTGVPVCDIAIASRSTTVVDLAPALAKLTAHARQRAVITYPASGHFIDDEILAVVGVAPLPLPDVLLVLGILRQAGHQPALDYIETPSRLAGCTEFDDFAQRVAWSTGPFDEAARQRLKAWFEADPRRALSGGRGMTWARISWRPAGVAREGDGSPRP